MIGVKLLNNVPDLWRESLTEEMYTTQPAQEQVVIVRSQDMHGAAIDAGLLAVGRAGAGVNNIPVQEYAEKGIPVFNTPGANANAVKELVIAGLLMASRDISGGIAWANGLTDGETTVAEQVEKGKKAFVGPELAGKTLGVIGLGAIGLMVANAGVALGMNVLGYDPYISIDNAWKLSRSVRHALSQDDVLANADYLSIHVPLTNETRGSINAEVFEKIKPGAALLNFARGELVNTDDVIAALESGKLRRYVCDFPSEALKNQKNCVCTPHLGASTPESADNCVRMVAKELDAYVRTGALMHCVNFPDVDPGRLTGTRIVVLHQNVPNVVSSITSLISRRNYNIATLLNRSRGALAVTILDLDECPNADVAREIGALDTVYRVRVLNP